MPTPSERDPRRSRQRKGRRLVVAAMTALAVAAGCGGEPSPRELKNRQVFEALLTAVSLKNAKELEADAKRIDDRRASGELSQAAYDDLQAVLRPARAGDWAAAEKAAYAFREAKPYFK